MEGIGVDRRIIIKWIEENGVGVSGLDLSLIILLVPKYVTFLSYLFI